MCIALPNHEGTFTVTLFLPNQGDPSFATINTGAQAEALFAREFADALPLIPNLRVDWEQHPPGLLGTLTWSAGTSRSRRTDRRRCRSTARANCAFEDWCCAGPSPDGGG